MPNENNNPYTKRQQAFTDHLAKINALSAQDSFQDRKQLLEQTALERLINGDYSEAINHLHLLQDNNQGIFSHLTNQDNPHSALFFRDARFQNGNDVQGHNDYANWAIIGINYINTIRLLYKAHHNVEKLPIDVEQLLKENALVFFNRVRQSRCDPERELKILLNRFVVPYVQENLRTTEAKARKLLANARDFCNFEQKSQSVATLTEVNNRNFLQLDVPMYQLTPTQVNWFENLDAQAWFNAVEKKQPLIAKIIKQFKPQILAGRQIPTQLRKFIPGLRNAGEERIYNYTNPNNPQEIYHGFHSGNPAHLISAKVNDELTEESFKQLQWLTSAKKVISQTLISPVAIIRHAEYVLFNQLKKAREKLTAGTVNNDFYISNTPFNFFRGIKSNYNSGIKFLINQVSQYLKKLDEDEHNNPDIVELQNLLDQCRRFKKGSPVTCDQTHINLKLAVWLNMLTYKYNHVLTQDDEENNFSNHIIQSSACQSGKDREGMHRFQTAAVAIGAHSQHIPLESIQEDLAKSGQIQKQAGMLGGTQGAVGIKKNTKGSFPKSWKTIADDLSRITASHNKAPKKPKKKAYMKQASPYRLANELTDYYINSKPTQVTSTLSTRKQYSISQKYKKETRLIDTNRPEEIFEFFLRSVKPGLYRNFTAKLSELKLLRFAHQKLPVLSKELTHFADLDGNSYSFDSAEIKLTAAEIKQYNEIWQRVYTNLNLNSADKPAKLITATRPTLNHS